MRGKPNHVIRNVGSMGSAGSVNILYIPYIPHVPTFTIGRRWIYKGAQSLPLDSSLLYSEF